MQASANSSYTLRDDGGLSKTIEITLDKGDLERIIEREVSRYTRQVRTPGFRPGKTPAHMIRSRYGDEIHKLALERLLEQTLYRALKDLSLDPEGPLQSRLKEASAGQHAGIFEISFEVFPPFDAESIKGQPCHLVKPKVSDDDIDTAIKDLKRRYTEWNESELAAAAGHRVSIAYTMEVDGKEIRPPEGDKRMHMDLVIGEEHMLPNLPKQLEGARPGDRKQVETRFPDGFPGPQLAGKSARLDLLVEKVSQASVPEIDDAFARRVDGRLGGREDLLRQVSDYLEHEAERLGRVINRRRVREALLERFHIELPPGLVKRNTEALVEEQRKRQEAGRHPQQPPPIPEQAEQRVRQEMSLGVIFTSLVRHHRLRAAPERVEALIRADAQLAKNPRKALQRISKSAEERRRYEQIVIEDMVFEHIIGALDAHFAVCSLYELRQASAEGQAALQPSADE